jgi:hypothetical protein
VNRWMARMMLSVVAIVVALSFCVTSVLFLGVALYMFLLSVMLAPAPAALIVGVVGLMVATLIILIVRQLFRPRPPKADALSLGDGANDLAAKLGGLIARRVASRTQPHPYAAIGIALVAGLAIGLSTELRKVLMGALCTRPLPASRRRN